MIPISRPRVSRYREPAEDIERRKRASANLSRILDGTVRREQEREAEQRARHREEVKRSRRRMKAITKRIAAVTTERDDLQDLLNAELLSDDKNPLGYAEGMDPAQYQGFLEELDCAVEGCNEEIAALRNEYDILRSIVND